MAIDTNVPRSRRALLAGGVGGLAALTASALGRPLPARADDGDIVRVGYWLMAESTTILDNATNAEPTLCGRGSFGDGLMGTSDASGRSGVYAVNTDAGGYGVYGENKATGSIGSLGSGTFGVRGHVRETGSGVRGLSPSGEGVYGTSSTGIGVRGGSTSGIGVHGTSKSKAGVDGFSESATGVHGTSNQGSGVHGHGVAGHGVLGTSQAAASAGTVGHSRADSCGVVGFSSGAAVALPGAPPRTGVFGYANQDAGARGVCGQSGMGLGVCGISTNGIGVYAAASFGFALYSSGRVRFDTVSGVATIAAGKTSVVVAPAVDISATSFVLLTPRGDIGARRAWYTANATANAITIRVSSASTSAIRIGWLLLG